MKPPYSGVASHDLPTRNRKCSGKHLLTTFCTFRIFLHVLTLFVISNLRLGARFGLSGCQILEAVVCRQFVVCPEPAKPPCDSLARTRVYWFWVCEQWGRKVASQVRDIPGRGRREGIREGWLGGGEGYPSSPSSQSLLLLSHLLSRCTRKKNKMWWETKIVSAMSALFATADLSRPRCDPTAPRCCAGS